MRCTKTCLLPRISWNLIFNVQFATLIFSVLAAYAAAGGMCHVQIFGALLQRGHLHPGWATVRVYYRCPDRAARWEHHSGDRAGAVQSLWCLSAQRGLSDPLAVHPSNRPGYYPGRYQTGGLLRSQRKRTITFLNKKKKYENNACILGRLPL